ncbi:MAG: hypothetical protein AAGU74_11090 [Bacillota bacterium]
MNQKTIRNLAWEEFSTTGKIGAYLVYKAVMGQGKGKRPPD